MRLGRCNRPYCEIRKAREDITPKSPLVAGAWRAQVHWLDQAWRVFCYSCTPILFSSGLILTWRVAERFFAEFFAFVFNNTSLCYLVVASFFLYSCALLLLDCCSCLCTRVVIGLLCFIYSCSALKISQSKNNLAIIFKIRV